MSKQCISKLVINCRRYITSELIIYPGMIYDKQLAITFQDRKAMQVFPNLEVASFVKVDLIVDLIRVTELPHSQACRS
jgi:hypothetical protein